MDRPLTAEAEETQLAGPDAPSGSAVGTSDLADLADLVEEDLLVEEISIDGMCGVY